MVRGLRNDQVEELLLLAHEMQYTDGQLASKYKVSRSSVAAILKGHSYQDIPRPWEPDGSPTIIPRKRMQRDKVVRRQRDRFEQKVKEAQERLSVN